MVGHLNIQLLSHSAVKNADVVIINIPVMLVFCVCLAVTAGVITVIVDAFSHCNIDSNIRKDAMKHIFLVHLHRKYECANIDNAYNGQFNLIQPNLTQNKI